MSSNGSFRVEIPHTPHPTLNPNHRAHPMARPESGGMSKVEARALLRRSANLATRSQLNAKPWSPPAGRLNLQLFVYWERGRIPRGKEMPDDDNLIASCKPLIDGLAAALGIDDKRFKFRGIDQDHDPQGLGCVVALITQED